MKRKYRISKRFIRGYGVRYIPQYRYFWFWIDVHNENPYFMDGDKFLPSTFEGAVGIIENDKKKLLIDKEIKKDQKEYKTVNYKYP